METMISLFVAAQEVFNRYGLQHVHYNKKKSLLIFLTMSKIPLVMWSQVMNHGFSNTILRPRGKVRSGTLRALLDLRKLEWANRRSNQCWLVFLIECKSSFSLNLKMSSKDFRKHPKECINRHAKDHTGWRLPALLAKVRTTSPSVCNCPRELFWRG